MTRLLAISILVILRPKPVVSEPDLAYWYLTRIYLANLIWMSSRPENPQADEVDDTKSLSENERKDFDKRGEQKDNPIDIDGILPVDASGAIVSI